MSWQAFEEWLYTADPLLVGAAVFSSLCLASTVGAVLRRFLDPPKERDSESEV
jgi:hypothetical protein